MFGDYRLTSYHVTVTPAIPSNATESSLIVGTAFDESTGLAMELPNVLLPKEKKKELPN